MRGEPGIPTNFRLSPAAHCFLGNLAAHLGVTRTAVVEMAVRKLHREEFKAREKSGKKSR